MKNLLKTCMVLFFAFTAISCATTEKLQEEARLKEEQMKLEYPVYEVPDGVSVREYIVSEEKTEVQDFEYVKSDIYKYRARIEGKYGYSYPDKAYHEAKKNLQKKLYLEGYKAALIIFKEVASEDGYYSIEKKAEIVDHFVTMEVEYYK